MAMKIFVLTSELTGKNGWGRYSMDLLGALSNGGVESVVALGVDGANDTKICAMKVLPSPLSYRKNYLLAIWYAWKLRKYVTDCDAIHSFIEPYSHVAYWLGKLTGKKYFITAHGTYAVLPYSFPAYKRVFHGTSFQGARGVICVSNYTKKRLGEFGLKNLSVIPNGLDFKKFYNPHVPSFVDREDLILSVGALKYRKGQHVSITAFARVCNTFKHLKYLIVGDQSDTAYFGHLKKLVTDLSIEGRVEFLDSISDEELMVLYRKSKLFALTSISEGAHFEGFGLVYLEAGACGLPVIGSLNSGAEDAIQQGKTGFLVPQNDPRSTADAITHILVGKDLAQAMGDKGVEWAKDHDWMSIVQSYITLYSTA